MQGKKILAETTTGPSALSMYEPGVLTHETHRRKGYGTIVSAKLIQEIEALGGQTYWNCAKQNRASAAIARNWAIEMKRNTGALHGRILNNHWISGNPIVLRGVWSQRLWFACPVVLVQNTPDLIAVYWRAGTWIKKPKKRFTPRDMLSTEQLELVGKM
jgi:hypothetical protein